MPRKYTNSIYLDSLQKKVLVFDGAMGTNLQKQNLNADHFGGEQFAGCNDILSLTYPQAIEAVHRSFLEVGVDVIETCTFRANRLTLNEYNLGSKTIDINRAAASLARKLADQYSTREKRRMVAGSIGPSGKLPSINDPQLSNITFSDLEEIFKEQAIGLIQGGVDLLLIETSQDILEVKAAISGIHLAFSETGIYLPIQAQVTLDTTGRMLLGTDIAAVLTILEGLPIDAIGLNCSTGPDYMREPLRYLCTHTTLPVSCIPNAGLPLNIDGQAVYPLEPDEFASCLTEYVNLLGINIVGGCCGTTPQHLYALIQKIEEHPQQFRKIQSVPRLASSTQAIPMRQEPPPFLIAERLNTQGSLKFKKLILAEDFDSINEMAQQQVENGAHGLDLCVALTERADEANLMQRLVKILSPVVSVPFIIDTTEPDVLQAALQTAPGRCLINSTNLESGQEKADKFFSLAKKYNAAVIALTIDESGMAKTAQRKLDIARRIYQIAVDQHELRPQDLVFDALTFTLATGDPDFNQSAIETLEGIRLIKKELPGVLTSLGISNVSFGLQPTARSVLNSVMLYHAILAGLDMAIVNPAHITPYPEIPAVDRELAEDLIFYRKENALQNLIEYFQKSGGERTNKGDDRKASLRSLPPSQRIFQKVVQRIKEEIENDIDEIILAYPPEQRSEQSVEILNTVLLPAMKEVGDRFGSGELILPFVLQSAEVMKKAVAHVETYLDRKEGVSKGVMVLATVYGDVHDIGKNLVKTILSNNGFTVHDLGKQVPAETIISKAIELNADAIGLSALLVTTSRQMPLIVNELHRRNLSIPVLIGGAAINRRFGRRILLTDQDQFYAGGVFYCKDAFEGLDIMEILVNPARRDDFIKQNHLESSRELDRQMTPPSTPSLQKSNVPPAPFIPKPTFWGARLVEKIPIDEVFNHLSINELFRLSWGAKNTHGEAWIKLEKEFRERLDKMRREALLSPWLFPKGAYGYYPCQSSGNDLIIFEPGSVNEGSPQELCRFKFPRQPDSDHLCLADYFLPIGSEQMDVVALQVVTVGEQATQRFEMLQNAGNFSEAYFSHGLAVQMAEACADYLHHFIRKELGIPAEQGKRYSWGYPAIPNLADHQIVFDLLPAKTGLNMELSPAFQLIPEQSTAAIIVHHPQARYFTVGETRIEQLTNQDRK